MADLNYPFSEIPALGEVTEVAAGVFWIRMPLPFSLDHINLWLLADGDSWTIVDSGIKAKSVQAAWEGLFGGVMAGKPVGRLICTHHHPDHFGLAGWLCERTGAMLWMARAEYFMGRALMLDSQATPPPEIMLYYKRAGLTGDEYRTMAESGYDWMAKVMLRPPASYRRLRDDDAFEIGGRTWRVVSGRGHSPEHICLMCPELNLLISGDQILPRISSNVSVWPTEPFSNPLGDWMESLHRFKALPDDLLVLPAHNEPFYGLHARLDQLIAGHEARLARVLAICAEPVTAVEVMPTMYRRKLEGADFNLGLGECLSHLHYLVDKGMLLTSDDAQGVRRFVQP